MDSAEFHKVALKQIETLMSIIDAGLSGKGSMRLEKYRSEFQERMTNYGSHIRKLEDVTRALESAYDQISAFKQQVISDRQEIPYYLQNRHLVIAHAAYLDAIREYLESGGGSRGSYMVMDSQGQPVLESLGDEWRYKQEETSLRDKVLETVVDQSGRYHSSWRERRPLPKEESWFENVWGAFLRGEIFEKSNSE
jgi:hypothetical protein